MRTINDLPPVDLPAHDAPELAAALAPAYARHGPIFRRRMPWGQDVVYLVGPEANRFVLVSNRLRFSHHVGWGLVMGVKALFGDGVLTMDGDRHAHHRRLIQPAFAMRYMQRYLPVMHRVIEERTADWAERGEVDVYEEARKITFDIAAQALAHLEPGAESDRYRELFYGMLTLGGAFATEEEYWRRMGELKRELEGMLVRAITDRRVAPGDDVLGLLMRGEDETGCPLDDAQLVAHMNILLVAGHETSTSLAAWLLYLLAEHPAYRDRVLAEQDALLPGDEPPTLENAAKEAERLYPPVPAGPRGVAEAFEFGGYYVPAGALVFYSILGSHRLPDVWAEPERFDPDRFAAPREEDKRTPFALVGFGGGPRACIGINFARIELTALASHVLRRYSLEVVPGQRIVQVNDGTARPAEGIRMRVVPR